MAWRESEYNLNQKAKTTASSQIEKFPSVREVKLWGHFRIGTTYSRSASKTPIPVELYIRPKLKDTGNFEQVSAMVVFSSSLQPAQELGCKPVLDGNPLVACSSSTFEVSVWKMKQGRANVYNTYITLQPLKLLEHSLAYYIDTPINSSSWINRH